MTAKRSGPAVHTVKIRTTRRTELRDITHEVEKLVDDPGCRQGMCFLYVPHTTAGVLVNEGYDPDVARDMEKAFGRLIPRDGDYQHAEGNSDSHIKTAFVGSSETLWIVNGRLSLGRWQKIFSLNLTVRAPANYTSKSFRILSNSFPAYVKRFSGIHRLRFRNSRSREAMKSLGVAPSHVRRAGGGASAHFGSPCLPVKGVIVNQK
jgi:secondary thiamine-phosphate synthase enzyme